MSDTAAPEPTSFSLERSPGVLIRKAREQRGLHIAALAAAMKVTPRKLEALEGDRWDELPDATFARALAQSVCRTLKVDPKPILDLMPPAAPAMREVPARSLNTNYSGTPSRDVGGTGTASMRPLVIAAGLLAVAAAVMFALPASVWNGMAVSPAASAAALGATPERASSPSVVSDPPSQAASAAVGTNSTVVSADGAASAAAPFSAAAANASVSAPVGTAEAVAAQAQATLGKPGNDGALGANPAGLAGSGSVAAGAAAVGATSATAVAAALAASQAKAAKAADKAASALPQNPNAALQIRAQKPSWVTVKDMRNRMLFDRQIPAGGQIGLDGEAPLSVIIGNAAGTEMRYNGKAVDIAARARGNVARIDLP